MKSKHMLSHMLLGRKRTTVQAKTKNSCKFTLKTTTASTSPRKLVSMTTSCWRDPSSLQCNHIRIRCKSRREWFRRDLCHRNLVLTEYRWETRSGRRSRHCLSVLAKDYCMDLSSSTFWWWLLAMITRSWADSSNATSISGSFWNQNYKIKHEMCALSSKRSMETIWKSRNLGLQKLRWKRMATLF